MATTPLAQESTNPALPAGLSGGRRVRLPRKVSTWLLFLLMIVVAVIMLYPFAPTARRPP